MNKPATNHRQNILFGLPLRRPPNKMANSHWSPWKYISTGDRVPAWHRETLTSARSDHRGGIAYQANILAGCADDNPYGTVPYSLFMLVVVWEDPPSSRIHW